MRRVDSGERAGEARSEHYCERAWYRHEGAEWYARRMDEHEREAARIEMRASYYGA